MRITFLGTGTSGGIPIINCQCAVCQSANPKNKRLRSSVMVEVDGLDILIDTSVDLRQQLLRHPFPRLDAILYTHAHADHIFGMDDIRRFNYLQKERIPIYGNRETIERLQGIFRHAFHDGPPRPGVPSVRPHIVDGRFKIKHVEVAPILLYHGEMPILGYRIGSFAYCTDVSRIPQESYRMLENLDLLVLDALRLKEHPTHFSLRQAVEQAVKIGARQTCFIHMSHQIEHEEQSRNLPENMALSYDGLSINIGEKELEISNQERENRLSNK